MYKPTPMPMGNNDGVFGRPSEGGFASSNSRAAVSAGEESDAPPVVSIWDIGVNPHKYSSDRDTLRGGTTAYR